MVFWLVVSMKRFNFLLVTKDDGLRPIVLKSLAKMSKSSFVFELQTLDEAVKILSKLNVDILMLDLDLADFDLVELSNRFPTMVVMGVATNPNTVRSNIAPLKHKVFEKRDFAISFATELKSQRKELVSTANTSERLRKQAPAASMDFVDFFKLSKVGKN
jgi:hypothetical protein